MTQPDTHLETIFEQWLDGKRLTDSQLKELQDNPIWSARMEACQALRQDALAMQSEPAPKPNTAADFQRLWPNQSWWQRQGLAAMAMTFAIMSWGAMLFDVRITMTDQGLSIANVSDMQQQIMTRELDRMLATTAQQIGARLDDIERQQLSNTDDWAQYILANTRSERQEDLVTVLNNLQKLRADDMRYVKDQFDDLQYQLRLARTSRHSGNQTEQSTAYSED